MTEFRLGRMRRCKHTQVNKQQGVLVTRGIAIFFEDALFSDDAFELA